MADQEKQEQPAVDEMTIAGLQARIEQLEAWDAESQQLVTELQACIEALEARIAELERQAERRKADLRLAKLG